MTCNYYLHTYLTLTLDIKSNVYCMLMGQRFKTCFYSFLRDDQLLLKLWRNINFVKMDLTIVIFNIFCN